MRVPGMNLSSLCELLDLNDAVEERIIESDVGHERAGARRSANPEDPLSAALQLGQQAEEIELRLHDAAPEVRERVGLIEPGLLLLVQAFPNRGIDRISPGSRREHADRPAMRRNALHPEDLQVVRFEEIPQACKRIVAQMFVINGVVLNGPDEVEQVVRFGDEHAARRQHALDRLDDVMDVRDVREHVRGRDDARPSMLLDGALGRLARKVVLDHR